MKKYSESTILNIGSAATFVAFPLLYSAVCGGSGAALFVGMALVVFGMAIPYIACRRKK